MLLQNVYNKLRAVRGGYGGLYRVPTTFNRFGIGNSGFEKMENYIGDGTPRSSFLAARAFEHGSASSRACSCETPFMNSDTWVFRLYGCRTGSSSFCFSYRRLTNVGCEDVFGRDGITAMQLRTGFERQADGMRAASGNVFSDTESD
jgi:hypothetical protein